MKETIKKQKQNTRDEFEERTKQVITELAEQVSKNATCFCFCIVSYLSLVKTLIKTYLIKVWFLHRGSMLHYSGRR